MIFLGIGIGIGLALNGLESSAKPNLDGKGPALAPRTLRRAVGPQIPLAEQYQSALLQLTHADPAQRIQAMEIMGRYALVENRAEEVTARLLPLCRDPKAQVRRSAILIVGRLGHPSVLPAVDHALRDEISVRRSAATVLEYVNARETNLTDLLGVALRDSDAEVRRLALHAIDRIPAEAAQSLLLPLLGDRDPGVRETAALELVQIGTDAGFRALEPLAEDPTFEGLHRVLHAAADHPAGAPLRFWAKIIAKPDAASRLVAIKGLGRLRTREAVHLLITAIRQAPEDLVLAGLRALDQMGLADSVHAIQQYTDDPRPAVRFQAWQTLARQQDARAMDTLLAGLRDPDPRINQAAIQGLAGVDRPPANSRADPARGDSRTITAVREFMRRMADSSDPADQMTRLRAVNVLEACGIPGLTALRQCLDDRDEHVRFHAIHGLWRIVLAAEREETEIPYAEFKQIAEAVMRISQADASGLNRADAAQFLQALGPSAAMVLIANDPAMAAGQGTRLQDIMAWGQSKNPATLPLLEEAVQDPDAVVQAAALTALQGRGAKAVPVFRRLLGHRSPGFRRSAIEFLMKHLQEDWLEDMIRVLQSDAVEEHRMLAARALAAQGDPAALPVLQAALKDPSPSVREAVREALHLQVDAMDDSDLFQLREP